MKTVTKKTVTITELKTHKFDNGFIGKETWVNGKLIDQYFQTPNSKKSHPYTYENGSLQFYYYPEAQTSLKSNEVIYETPLGDYKSDIKLIEDLESFNDWDNVILHHLSMDGNIYRIDSPYPFSVWKERDYISGFCNDNFDLPKVAAKLKTFDWIRNVEIKDIPYYNCDEGILDM